MDDVTVETLRVMKRLGPFQQGPRHGGRPVIAPRDLVVSLLPEPKDLAGRMRGKTCVGTLAKGLKNGDPEGVLHLQRRRSRDGLQHIGCPGDRLSDRYPAGYRRPADSRRHLDRRGCNVTRAVRSRSFPGAAPARRDAVGMLEDGAATRPGGSGRRASSRGRCRHTTPSTTTTASRCSSCAATPRSPPRRRSR